MIPSFASTALSWTGNQEKPNDDKKQKNSKKPLQFDNYLYLCSVMTPEKRAEKPKDKAKQTD